MVLLTFLRRWSVPVLVILFVALWFILRGDLLYVFPCVIFFLCFSVLLVLRLPRLGKRELILVLFVRLFDLCLFGFVGFLFLLGSGKGCGLWLWHSLDFSLTFFRGNLNIGDLDRPMCMNGRALLCFIVFCDARWVYKRTVRGLIRLSRCTGWSRHSLSAGAQRRFSHGVAHLLSYLWYSFRT